MWHEIGIRRGQRSAVYHFLYGVGKTAGMVIGGIARKRAVVGGEVWATAPVVMTTGTSRHRIRGEQFGSYAIGATISGGCLRQVRPREKQE